MTHTLPGSRREVMRLAWPIGVSMLSFTLKGFIDTLMVGQLGTDGRKMSKTYGNHVGLNASSDDMFGKVMSLSDESMVSWFSLATQMSTAEIEAQLTGHPREAKDCLARAVVTELHSADAAAAASAEFVRRFQKKEQPSEIPEKSVAAGSYALPALMRTVGLASSTSDARRLIQGGGVRLNEAVIKDVHHQVNLEEVGSQALLQAGKRRFARITAE